MENDSSNGTNELSSSMSAKTAGIISLVLIFFASASFTWIFLADTAPEGPISVAAAAQVSPEENPAATPSSFSDITLRAKSAIVVDSTSGQTLFDRNADTPLALASLTKVPLALVVAETLPPSTVVTIPYDVSPYGMHAGERWRLQDIIDFTLAVSSNAGADILASTAEDAIQSTYPHAPAKEATVWRMNELARQIGLTHTYFLNPTGLDESETQAGAYGSARDMATLFAYVAASKPSTFAATTKSSFKLHSLEGAEATAVNTDEALPSIPGMILGKTGFTDLAGGNLAVVFDVNGHRISAIVLGSTQGGRFEDMKTLVEATIAALRSS